MVRSARSVDPRLDSTSHERGSGTGRAPQLRPLTRIWWELGLREIPQERDQRATVGCGFQRGNPLDRRAVKSQLPRRLGSLNQMKRNVVKDYFGEMVSRFQGESVAR